MSDVEGMGVAVAVVAGRMTPPVMATADATAVARPGRRLRRESLRVLFVGVTFTASPVLLRVRRLQV
ncbi:hypothetical protein [Streptomyces cavernicola]|uniref:Uncharacterized protein n=1 Tax=Streptomyces cavernicola TaxID=3043613 RepID=A0ABT6S383_9ACTN|nr:hypothetical protein [Streptomyces sp. B-S-A6]MDI3402546.1 hypothetical protein [Streptomyces sp. B-S-A6]